jgi:hypothetical protein
LWLDAVSFFFFFLLEVDDNDLLLATKVVGGVLLPASDTVLLPGEVDFLCDEEVDVHFVVTALEALAAVLLPNFVLFAASGSVLDVGTPTTSIAVMIAVFLLATAICLSLFSPLVNLLVGLLTIFGFCRIFCYNKSLRGLH